MGVGVQACMCMCVHLYLLKYNPLEATLVEHTC